MFCRTCGNANTPGETFCRNCGTTTTRTDDPRTSLTASPVTRGAGESSEIGLVVLGVVGALLVVIVVAFVLAAGGGPGPCKGGVDLLDQSEASWVSSDGQHWTATVRCSVSGEKTLHRTGTDPIG